MRTKPPDPLAYLGDDLDARQIFQDTNRFLALIDSMLDDEQREALAAANPDIWTIEQFTGFRSSDRRLWHFGFVLALEELSKHPHILQFAVRDLYKRMREYLPEPFTVIDDICPETRRKVLQLIARLLDEE